MHRKMRAQVRVARDLDRLGEREVPRHRLNVVDALIAGLAVGQVSGTGDPCVDADVGAHGVGRAIVKGEGLSR